MMRKSLHIPEEDAKLVEELYRRNVAEGIDEFDSEAEIYRRAISIGLEEIVEGDADLLDKWTKIEHKRNKNLNNSRKKVKNYRAYFAKNLKEHLISVLKAGAKKQDIEALREEHKEQAKILWQDDEERRQEAYEQVDEWVDQIQLVKDISQFDPVDTESVLSSFGSVADELEQAEDLEEIPEAVQTLHSRLREGTGRSPMTLIEDISRAYQIDADRLKTAVESLTGKRINRIYAEDLEESGIHQIDTDDIAVALDANSQQNKVNTSAIEPK